MKTPRWFDCSHLPPHLQKVVQPFQKLAFDLCADLELTFGCSTDVEDESRAEIEAFLRKLLEAKDCAVRAAIVKREAQS